MTAEKRNQGKGSWVVVGTLAGGALLFLVLRLLTPQVPDAGGQEDYTFQPEPRRPPVNLQKSSGALGNQGSVAAPSVQSSSCESLQQFANYEYERRYQQGKLSELMIFSGFERAEMFITANDTLNCTGGEFVRQGKSGERRCKNVILSYDTGSNTLAYNIQYVYLERGLQPECRSSR
jgi:hypothetical protein